MKPVVLHAKLVDGRKHPEGVTFHTLRYGMASLAWNAGVPEHAVMAMGNCRSRTMVSRYAHLADKSLRDAAGKLASLVGRGHTMVTNPAKAAQHLALTAGANGGCSTGYLVPWDGAQPSTREVAGGAGGLAPGLS